MSRIGRLPIDIPAGVEVKIEEGNKVTVKGPKGTLEKCLPVEMTIKQEDNQVVVTRPNDLKKSTEKRKRNHFQPWFLSSGSYD